MDYQRANTKKGEGRTLTCPPPCSQQLQPTYLPWDPSRGFPKTWPPLVSSPGITEPVATIRGARRDLKSKAQKRKTRRPAVRISRVNRQTLGALLSTLEADLSWNKKRRYRRGDGEGGRPPGFLRKTKQQRGAKIYRKSPFQGRKEERAKKEGFHHSTGPITLSLLSKKKNSGKVDHHKPPPPD